MTHAPLPAMLDETSREHAYLHAALTSMPQGISVFDENLRLRLWNPSFIELVDLPAESVYAGAHFSDLIRHPAQRGDYGEGDPESHVQALSALAARFQRLSFERTRTDGRTRLVQNEPIFIAGRPAGFIATYTDISERKQAEEGLRRQHDLLQTVLETIPSGISVFDRDLNLLLHNREFQRLLDFPEGMLSEQTTLADIFHFNAHRGEYGPGDPGEIIRKLLARANEIKAHRFQRLRPNGVTLDIRGAPLKDGGFVTIYSDISERQASAEREQLAQMVFNHSPTGIVLTDDGHRILSLNPALSEMTGYDVSELLGQTMFALTHPLSDFSPHQLECTLNARGLWNGELHVIRKDGGEFPAGVRVSRVHDPKQGKPSHHVWIVADITERKQNEERMRHIAQHDMLTGLPNRLNLLSRLSQLLPETRRYGRLLAMLFIDLDRFKIINDTLGHAAGDELLREVAIRLAGLVRETDFVARLGGDEFVVLLPSISQPNDAAIVAQKIIATLSAPIEAEGHELHTSPSIGISIFPDDGLDATSILKSADMAMYHAKSLGRNNFQFFSADMNRAAAERLSIEHRLRHAISRNELSLCYQPQVRASDGRPTGVEALLRWEHPEEGPISPARFIPVAEETGIICEIGQWVLQQACHDMRAWLNAGLPPIRMAVNVSARQLRQHDFCEQVAEALALSGLPPALLEVEITESSVMENPQEAIDILSRLREMGITLAIDDFGTGYSSLAYLKLFPIDRLKIDRSFVADIEHDLNDRAIAIGAIALAHSLGLTVIAEGVESGDQLELLRSNGCDEIQGYLFSRPLNGAAAFAFLHAHTQG